MSTVEFSGAGCHTEISVPTGSTETVPDNCTGQYSDAFGNAGTGTLQSTLTISTPGASLCFPNTDGASDVLASAHAGSRLTGSCPVLMIKANPISTAVYGPRPEPLTLAVNVLQGCAPYTYLWHRSGLPANAAPVPTSGKASPITVSYFPRK
jgi:hypothetical protein